MLTTIATTRTNHLAATHHPFNQARTLGFHSGFLSAGAFALLAILGAAVIGTRRFTRSRPAATVERREDLTAIQA